MNGWPDLRSRIQTNLVQNKNISFNKTTPQVLDGFFTFGTITLLLAIMAASMGCHGGYFMGGSLGTVYVISCIVALICILALFIFFMIILSAYHYIKRNATSSLARNNEQFSDCLTAFETCWNSKNKPTQTGCVAIIYACQNGKLASKPYVMEIDLNEKTQTLLGIDKK